ncbi:MAG: endolytic transglycosylase MltG, partial [Patescibacteria group bacterium]
SAEDLAMESPYNTRLNKGLPPTGISNPGLASLEGAIYPEDSEYWFYLTNLEGEVFYAKTNEEHERNKEKHL